jgi:hypothetical protein
LKLHHTKSFKIKIKMTKKENPKTPKTLKKPAPPTGSRSLAALRERHRNLRLLQAAEIRGIQQAELEGRETERRRREHEASLRHAEFARIQEEIEIGLIRQEAAAQVAEEEAQEVRRLAEEEAQEVRRLAEEEAQEARRLAEEEAQEVRRYNTNRRTYIIARVYYHGTVAPVYPSDSDDLGPYEED